MALKKEDLLQREIKHIDITRLNVAALVEAMKDTHYQAKNLARGCEIYETMLQDPHCTIILCLGGSLINAGMKKIVIDLIQNNMIDVIISTAVNIVDQDFFEALGFKYYQDTTDSHDIDLSDLAIERIYNTLVNTNDLRICDATICKIADSLPPRSHSSREFINEMGRYLAERQTQQSTLTSSIILAAYTKKIPIFCPTFSDCRAISGLTLHQSKNLSKHLSIDTVKDFRELTDIKSAAKASGLLIIGSGAPKDFAQNIVNAQLRDKEVPFHKYAIQITADEKDGNITGSSLHNNHPWGKTSTAQQQMISVDATIAFPILAANAYQKGYAALRKERRWNKLFTEHPTTENILSSLKATHPTEKI